ncbi:hypothetical protein JYT74_00385 [Crocinitomix catalasitica]|nr:hypothetical protein [Crocinitomix catalasitica]
MSKKGIIIAFLCSAFSYISFAQTGYYGSRHSFEVKVDIASSLKRRDNIKTNSLGVDFLKRPLRLVHSNIGINYNFVTSRRMELSFGAEYSQFRESSIDGRFNPGTSLPIEDLILAPKATLLSAKFELKFYRKGSISPIGKYLGFSLHFGSASVGSGRAIRWGDLGTTTGGFFVKQQEIFTESISFTDSSKKRVHNLTLQGKMGRVWPLTQHFSVVTGLSFPIGSMFFVQDEFFPRLSPLEFLEGLGGSTYTLQTNQGGGWDSMLINTIRRTNSLALEVSFRFHL